jgi:hypothetical protein
MLSLETILKEVEKPINDDVREEIRRIAELYIDSDLLRRIADTRLNNLIDKMIERLRNIKDPEAKKLLNKIERDKSLRTVISILDRYERLMRKQNLY